MKTQIKDGGSAFPEVETDLEHKVGDPYPRTYSYGGMTLRDYFAAKAMQAQITNADWLKTVCNDAAEQKMKSGDLLAEISYELADAMLVAREECQP